MQQLQRRRLLQGERQGGGHPAASAAQALQSAASHAKKSRVETAARAQQ